MVTILKNLLPFNSNFIILFGLNIPTAHFGFKTYQPDFLFHLDTCFIIFSGLKHVLKDSKSCLSINPYTSLLYYFIILSGRKLILKDLKIYLSINPLTFKGAIFI